MRKPGFPAILSTITFTLIALVSLPLVLGGCDFNKLLGIAPEDATPPGPVTSLVAEPGNGAVLLSWTDPGDGDFDRVIITTSPGARTTLRARGEGQALVGGLVNGQTYSFDLRAADSSGNASVAATAQAVPLDEGDRLPPGEVANLSSSSAMTSVRLSWEDPADADLAFIEISLDPPELPPLIRAPGEGTALFEGLAMGSTYGFEVRTVDGSWNRSAGLLRLATTTTGVDSQVPNPVTGLAATAGDELVNLAWTDPGDLDLNLVEVEVYSDTAAPPDRLLIFGKGVMKARIDGLLNGTAYEFRVRALDRAGNHSSPAVATATPLLLVDTTPPEILRVWTVPEIPKAGSPFRIEVEYSEPESAVTIAYDTDGNLDFLEAQSSTPAMPGTASVSVRLSNADGLSAELAHSFTVASAGLYPGNYAIDWDGTALDIAGLAPYVGVNGSLVIAGTDLASLDGLENITEVRGDLYIDDNPYLTDISALGAVTRVDGSLCLGHWNTSYPHHGSNLPLVSLDGLHIAAVGGDLILHGMGAATLGGPSGGLDSLCYVGGSILVESCSGIVNLDELSGLTAFLSGNLIGTVWQRQEWDFYVNARLAIVNNDNLSDLSGLGGIVADGLYLQGNDSLQDLTGLGGVRARAGMDLIIKDNPELLSLGALAQAGRITRHLAIVNNDKLTSLAGLGLGASVSGRLYVIGNERLADLAALAPLTSVGGDVSISANGLPTGGLASLAGLENLRIVGGYLDLSDNPFMTDLSALSLASIGGDVYLRENDLLLDFSGAGLSTGLGSVGASLLIVGNDALSSLGGLDIDYIQGGILVSDNLVLTDLGALDSCSLNDPSLRYLIVARNAALPDLVGLGGFSFVQQAGYGLPAGFSYAVELSDNDSLTDVAALDGLVINSGSMLLRGNISLSALTGLSGLSITTGDLAIGSAAGGTYLGSLDGLSGLKITGGSLGIQNNPALVSLAALSSLDPASSFLDLAIVNCDLLGDLGGLEAFHLVRRLSLDGNATLASIAAFGDLGDSQRLEPQAVYITACPLLSSLAGLEGTTAAGNLRLGGLPALTDLGGLANLASLSGWLWIDDCDNLAAIGLPSLVSIGNDFPFSDYPPNYLSGIYNCDQLLNLTGAGGMTLLASVANLGSGKMAFAGNAILPQAEIDALGVQIGGW